MCDLHYVTCESVTEGHPDKFCDQVSDAILDDILEHDPDAHVAIETLATFGKVVVAGEVTSTYLPRYVDIVQTVINKIGYSYEDTGDLSIEVFVHEQSPDINRGVVKVESEALGAGDQGIMYGYATNETPELLPLPYVLATKIVQKLDKLRHLEPSVGWRCDGKSQVTVAYDEQGDPLYVDTVVVSVQHLDDVELSSIKSQVKIIIKECLGSWWNEDIRIYINPTGRFVIGGFAGDTGLTGRKLAVDTYGGVAHHGAGAFSGKDPTKVDRSGAYFTRMVAKSLVLAKFCKKCEVSVSYAIGKISPVHVQVDMLGTSLVKGLTNSEISRLVQTCFDFTPAGIIKYLDLKRPIYRDTAVYGHFTDSTYPWESQCLHLELEEE